MSIDGKILKEINKTIPGVTTETVAHPSHFNPVLQPLLDNDVTLAAKLETMVSNDTPVFTKQIQSTVSTGTAPLQIASTTKVNNLNADMVDGYHFDQSLQTNSNPTFAGLNITGTLKLGNKFVVRSNAKNGTDITISTNAPSGGEDGDIWFQYS